MLLRVEGFFFWRRKKISDEKKKQVFRFLWDSRFDKSEIDGLLNPFVTSATTISQEASNGNSDGDGKNDGTNNHNNDDPDKLESCLVAEKVAVSFITVAHSSVDVANSVSHVPSGRTSAVIWASGVRPEVIFLAVIRPNTHEPFGSNVVVFERTGAGIEGGDEVYGLAGGCDKRGSVGRIVKNGSQKSGGSLFELFGADSDHQSCIANKEILIIPNASEKSGVRVASQVGGV